MSSKFVKKQNKSGGKSSPKAAPEKKGAAKPANPARVSPKTAAAKKSAPARVPPKVKPGVSAGAVKKSDRIARAPGGAAQPAKGASAAKAPAKSAQNKPAQKGTGRANAPAGASGSKKLKISAKASSGARVGSNSPAAPAKQGGRAPGASISVKSAVAEGKVSAAAGKQPGRGIEIKKASSKKAAPESAAKKPSGEKSEGRKISISAKASASNSRKKVPVSPDKPSSVPAKKQKKAEKQSEAPLSGLAFDEPAGKKFAKRQKRARHSESIYFSLEDLDAYFENREAGVSYDSPSKSESASASAKVSSVPKQQKVKKASQTFDAASIADILGFNPVEVPTREKYVEKEIPRKWKKYYNMLVELRKKHSEGLTERSEEVMKRSVKDDSGDLSSYGQHLADAGSESFDRDMAYSLLSSERELIREIDAAVDRMRRGVYGVCEFTGEPIPEERLAAIPFTRYTKEGQERKELEMKRAKSMQRTAFGDIPSEVSGGEDEISS